MIKKTHFTKWYNFTATFAVWSVGPLLLSLLFYSIRSKLAGARNGGLTWSIAIWAGMCANVLFAVFAVLFLMVACSVFAEISDRHKHDRVRNLFKSVLETDKLHRFLHFQQEKMLENKVMVEAPGTAVIRHYNRLALKSIVDIRQKNVFVVLKVPKSHQAQVLLNDTLDRLKEQLSARMPTYYFSAPQRVKNELWLVGDRRQ